MNPIQSYSGYSQWKKAAIEDDKKTGRYHWKKVDYSSKYDYKNILDRYKLLKKLREQKNYHDLLFVLNEGIHGNMGGMGNRSLYKHARFGTKDLIDKYTSEIAKALEYIASDEITDISRHEKIDFYHRASHCYGRSALLLSGAGMRLFFHIGVVKALWEEGLLPSIVAGSSGGSVVAACVGTHTQEEIARLFDPEYMAWEIKQDVGLWLKVKKLAFNAIDRKDVVRVLHRLVPDLTFQEAYERTGRHISISIAPAALNQTSRQLNAITSPNVYVREAVLASTALPFVFPPERLAAKNVHGERQPYLPTKRWVDGSCSEDLPLKRLSRLYGVNHYIVSQINPLAVPFISRQDGTTTMSRVTNSSQLIMKEFVNIVSALLEKPTANIPAANNLVRMIAALARQTYTGDITILPPSRLAHPQKLMSHKSEEEMMELIEAGERATWPEIERIRVQTTISRKLDEILKRMEDYTI